MEYDNYFSDFGLRCFELLKPMKKIVKTKKRDVTAALCVMSAALTIPHEVLACVRNGDPATHSHHPSGTTLRYPKAAAYYAEELQKSFVDSLGAGGKWHKDALPLKWAVDWPSLANGPPALRPMPKDTQVEEVLTILRNTLAHGTVGTYAEGQIIETLVFMAACKWHDLPKKNKGFPRGTPIKFDVVHVSTTDFTKFMTKWKELLQCLGREAKKELATGHGR